MFPGEAYVFGFPLPVYRPLMDEHTFFENFVQEFMPHKTYLCYEVELQEDDAWIPVDEFKGFLCNQVTKHSRQDLPNRGYSGRSFSVYPGCPRKLSLIGPRSCCGSAWSPGWGKGGGQFLL